MEKSLFAVVCFATAACGSSDSHVPEISQRDASAAECTNGGTVLLVDAEERATVCNGVDGTDGSDGATGATGATGVQGQQGVRGVQGLAGRDGSSAGVSANGRCSASYTSGDNSVLVGVEWVELSDGNMTGICYAERRNYGLVDIAQYTGRLCFLIDWTSLDPDGGTDSGGRPLALDLLVDVEGETVREGLGGPLLTTLSCSRFDPVTGDLL